MKTFKIQPRKQAEATAKPEAWLSDRQNTKRKKIGTPLSLKSKGVISDLLENSKIKAANTSPPSKSTRSKNRSFIDNGNAHTMYNLRLTASEFSAFLDNEVFRIRTEADRQKYAVSVCFEELGVRLARKLNYLQNYVEQQVTAVIGRLAEEKTKLDQALTCVDQFLEYHAEQATILDVQTLQEALVCDFKDLPSSISIPEVVDSHELFQTFNALLEGHVCRQEIQVNAEAFDSFLAKTTNIFDLSDHMVSQSILRVNQNAMNQAKPVKTRAHIVLESDFSRSSVYQQASGKPKQKSYDGHGVKASPKLPATRQQGQASPAGPATPYLEYALRRKSRSSTKLESPKADPDARHPLFKATGPHIDPYQDGDDAETETEGRLGQAGMSLDLECHENMDAILPRSILHIEELPEED